MEPVSTETGQTLLFEPSLSPEKFQQAAVYLNAVNNKGGNFFPMIMMILDLSSAQGQIHHRVFKNIKITFLSHKEVSSAVKVKSY